MPPQVVRQQTAVPCNVIPPTTNFLRRVFLPALISLLTIEIGGVGMGEYSVHVQHYSHDDDTTCMSVRENGTFGGHQRSYCEQHCPARVVHPTLLSGFNTLPSNRLRVNASAVPI
jgi:hypothetical protein